MFIGFSWIQVQIVADKLVFDLTLKKATVLSNLPPGKSRDSRLGFVVLTTEHEMVVHF